MSTAEHGVSIRSAPRMAFGAVLFVGWAVETFLWVYATIHSVADGEITPLITALGAIALLILLAGMEGLEVAVIDRWRSLYPQRTTSDLAAVAGTYRRDQPRSGISRSGSPGSPIS